MTGLFNFFTTLWVLSFVPVFAQDTLYCVDLHQTDFEHYDIFNQDIEGKKIIMLGEIHYMAANSILQADLFMHLNKQFGVRHLLIEFGRAEAYLYNQYLQTGDEWFLNHTFHGFNRYKEFFTSWKKLYDYNAGLDTSKKLVVHGLDFEREPGLSASMYKLLSPYSTNPPIKSLLDSIKIRLDTIGIERDTKDYIYYLRERIPALSLPDDENKKVMNEILNNNSFHVNFSERDKNMIQTFLALDTTDEVYLGQFGLAHTLLNNKNMLTGDLYHLEKYHNKVLAIQMYYGDSTRSNILDDVSDCSNYLYKINPADKQLGGFRKRAHWIFFLRNKDSYTTKD